MSEMRPVEAITHARKLTKFLDAFKNIEDVIGAAVSAEKSIPKLQKERSSLVVEVDNFRIAKIAAAEDFKKFKAEKAAQADDLNRKHSELAREINHSSKKLRDAFNKQSETIRKDLSSKKALHEDFVRNAKAQESKLINKIDMLQGELDKLKSRLASV